MVLLGVDGARTRSKLDELASLPSKPEQCQSLPAVLSSRSFDPLAACCSPGGIASQLSYLTPPAELF